MPSKTLAQARFMAAVANNPKFAKKAGVAQSVGQEFVKADRRSIPKPRPTLQKVNKAKTSHGPKTKVL